LPTVSNSNIQSRCRVFPNMFNFSVFGLDPLFGHYWYGSVERPPPQTTHRCEVSARRISTIHPVVKFRYSRIQYMTRWNSILPCCFQKFEHLHKFRIFLSDSSIRWISVLLSDIHGTSRGTVELRNLLFRLCTATTPALSRPGVLSSSLPRISPEVRRKLADPPHTVDRL